MSFDKRYKTMKVILVLLAVSLVISLFFNRQYAKSLDEEEREYRTYVNHFYSEVRGTRLTLDDLLKDSQPIDQVNKELKRLSKHLNRLTYISSREPHYISGVQASGINVFEKASYVLLNGSNEYKEIPSFIQNPQISDGEREYLEGIQAHIQYIHNQLYSEETNQEKKDLTKEEMNEVINYISDLINQHDELLNAYLEEMDSY